MHRIINFVTPGVSMNPDERLVSPYGYLIVAILKPIIKHLPDYVMSPKPCSSSVNVHFFFRGSKMPGSISVFVQHGLADKGLLSAKAMKNFDYVCVSGPAWVEKLVNQGMREQQIRVVGYPPLDPAFQACSKTKTDSQKTVIYAPTHSNSSPSTYPKFLDYLASFPDSYRIIVSEHPYDRNDRSPSMPSLIDSDVVITDCGSIMYEAWALGKAVIFPDWLCKEKVIKRWPYSYEADIYKNQLGYHAVDFGHLLELIELALEKGMGEKEKAFIEGIFPRELRGYSGKIAARTLEGLSDL